VYVLGQGNGKSVDGGVTLGQFGISNMFITGIVASPVIGTKTIYAIATDATNVGAILRSSDGATTWNAITDGLPNQLITTMAVSADGDSLVAGLAGGSLWVHHGP
jgi:photosystem II stability/assembly factor-like uncharacterized protein